MLESKRKMGCSWRRWYVVSCVQITIVLVQSCFRVPTESKLPSDLKLNMALGREHKEATGDMQHERSVVYATWGTLLNCLCDETYIKYAFHGEQFQEGHVVQMQLMAIGEKDDTSHQITISMTISNYIRCECLYILLCLGFQKKIDTFCLQ